jgi:hypothetical protein
VADKGLHKVKFHISQCKKIHFSHYYHIIMYRFNKFYRAEPFLSTNSCSTNHEIPCILWNPKVHYCFQKTPSLGPFLSQINKAHILTPYFLKNNFTIIPPGMLRSPKWSPPSGFPTKMLYPFQISLMCPTHPAHHILLDSTTIILFRGKYKL